VFIQPRPKLRKSNLRKLDPPNIQNSRYRSPSAGTEARLKWKLGFGQSPGCCCVCVAVDCAAQSLSAAISVFPHFHSAFWASGPGARPPCTEGLRVFGSVGLGNFSICFSAVWPKQWAYNNHSNSRQQRWSNNSRQLLRAHSTRAISVSFLFHFSRLPVVAAVIFKKSLRSAAVMLSGGKWKGEWKTVKHSFWEATSKTYIKETP